MEHDRTHEMDGSKRHTNMKKFTVMIVFWDLGIGGLQTIIRDVVQHIRKTRPNISVLVFIKNSTDSHILKELKNDGFTQIYSLRTGNGKNRILRHLQFLIWVAYSYITIRPDVCLTFLVELSFFMIALKKIFFWKKVKLVLAEGVVTSSYIQINKYPRWLWNLCIQMLYPKANCILVPTLACKNDLVESFHILESIIYITVNWTTVKKARASKKIYDLMYLGRFEKEKNPLALIALVRILKKRYPRISLCLVGKGSLEKQMREESSKYGLNKNIIFAGFSSSPEVLLGKAKILVSMTLNEGLPVSVLEAGMQRVPCVSTSFIGSQEIILHNKTGLLYNSISDMASGIDCLLSNPSRRKKMGEEAYVQVTKRFGAKEVEKFTATLLEI